MLPSLTWSCTALLAGGRRGVMHREMATRSLATCLPDPLDLLTYHPLPPSCSISLMAPAWLLFQFSFCSQVWQVLEAFSGLALVACKAVRSDPTHSAFSPQGPAPCLGLWDAQADGSSTQHFLWWSETSPRCFILRDTP